MYDINTCYYSKGLKTWALIKREGVRLDIFERKVLRWIAHIMTHKPDNIDYKTIRIHQESVSKTFTSIESAKRRLIWVGCLSEKWRNDKSSHLEGFDKKMTTRQIFPQMNEDSWRRTEMAVNLLYDIVFKLLPHPHKKKKIL